MAPIVRTAFSPARFALSDEVLQIAAADGLGRHCVAELVFINGHYAPTASKTGKLPRGMKLASLAQAIAEDALPLEQHLGRLADIHQNPFVAWNTSWLREGAVIHVPRGVNVDGPIHLSFIATADGAAVVNHPRVLVIAEPNTDLTLVETYVGHRGPNLTNAVTEIFAGDDCRLNYNRIQQGDDEAMLVSTLAVSLGRGGQFVSHCATLGGKVTRNDLNVTLAGEGGDATLNGLVILDREQHCDNHTLLDHAAAHCPSHELYKHVLDGKSSCVFKGQILVRPDSQKTDSKQTSKSLLLSDEASMNSQPALEIYADDVKCTHGSTIGPVDEEMIFYLRSRGVGLEAARHLLTYAFAADITRRIKVEPVRTRLEDFLAAQHGLPRDLRITDLGEHDEKTR